MVNEPGSATLDLLERFQSSAGFRLPSLRRVVDAARTVVLESRQPAFAEDQVCPRVYVVRRGLLKQLYTKDDGTEWIKSFAREGELFGCPIALAPGGRTTFASVAIEPAVVESTEWRLVEDLGQTSLPWQKAIRYLFQRLAEVKVRRERDLLMLSAAELYRQLAAEAPDLVARVPQKDLAAFLGVTPVGLNRIVRRQAPSRRRNVAQ